MQSALVILVKGQKRDPVIALGADLLRRAMGRGGGVKERERKSESRGGGQRETVSLRRQGIEIGGYIAKDLNRRLQENSPH